MVVIILTSTVFVQNKIFLHQTNPQERIECYRKSIEQWLNTNFKIIIVENSGYPFDEFKNNISERFEIISFNEQELPEASYLFGNDSKGASELFSINYSIRHSKIIELGDFIIKITARYFIPNFEEYLYNLNQYDGLCQNDINRCEIVGCHYTKKEVLFDLNGVHPHIEFTYTSRIQSMDAIIILPVLEISPTQAGGYDIRYSSL